eukprot:13046606-Alexandrium_andersonii.AAC.1
MEPLFDPRADGSRCSHLRHCRARGASSPAARDACGPPAPGAHPWEVYPEGVEAGCSVLYICSQHSVSGQNEVCCSESVASVEAACSEKAALDYRQRSAGYGRVRVIRMLSEGRCQSRRAMTLRPARPVPAGGSELRCHDCEDSGENA